jgi:hypothetical protein
MHLLTWARATLGKASMAAPRATMICPISAARSFGSVVKSWWAWARA